MKWLREFYDDYEVEIIVVAIFTIAAGFLFLLTLLEQNKCKTVHDTVSVVHVCVGHKYSSSCLVDTESGVRLEYHELVAVGSKIERQVCEND